MWNEDEPAKRGIGECGIIPGLSYDDRPDFEEKLMEVVNNMDDLEWWLSDGLKKFPGI